MLQPASAVRASSSELAIMDRRREGRGKVNGGMALNIVIMAAGKGTRMRSSRPKVLHNLAGRHSLQHVLDAAAGLAAERTVVVTGHGAEAVEKAVTGDGLAFVRQEPQLGTGHAGQAGGPPLGPPGPP